MSSSKEFFINMKENDIPKWNTKLSYYDQDLAVIDFYNNELKKIKEGLNVGGWFVHPFLYWHINYFKARIVQKDNTEPITNPLLDDHLIYFTENYKEAEDTGKGICLFGTRGFSKTVLEASLAHWLSVTRPNSIISINGGSTSDLNDVCRSIALSNKNVHPAFRLPILRGDWDEEVLFGWQEGVSERTVYSRLDITNQEGGKDSASEKSAGGTPAGLICDEIGKFDPRPFLYASKSKIYSQYGARFVPFLAGTGGNEKLSVGARYIMEHPDEFDLLRMNWDRLDRSVPEDCQTWKLSKKTSFCTFVPGQMSYRLPTPKIETELSSFLGIEEKSELDDIKLYKTDWVNATQKLYDELEAQKSEAGRNKRLMYHPMDISHCFLTDSVNPFNVSRLERKLDEITRNPTYRKMTFSQSANGDVVSTLSDKLLATDSYVSKDVDAPILVFEDPSVKTQKFANCAGFDDYKTTEAKDSTSLGCLYIVKRRNLDINIPIEKIVMSYTARPHSSHNILYENIRLSLKRYSALCNVEAADLGFTSYLETLGFNIMDYVIPNINPSSDLTSKNNKSNSRYGTYPTPGNIKILMDTVINYTNEEVVVGFDDSNNPIVVYGSDFIEDPYLLKEMIDFHPKGNFDRIMAFGWALVYAQYLDKKNITPKTVGENIVRRDDYKDIKPKTKLNVFSNVRFKNF